MMSDTEARLRDYEAGLYGGLKANAWQFFEETDASEGASGSRSVDFSAAERGAINRIEQDRSQHRRFHRAFLRLSPHHKNVLERYASDIGGQKFRVGGLGS